MLVRKLTPLYQLQRLFSVGWEDIIFQTELKMVWEELPCLMSRYCSNSRPYVLSNITENVRIISALTEIRTVYIPNRQEVLAAFLFEACMKGELENVWKEIFVV
jgi:hypothetical protein